MKEKSKETIKANDAEGLKRLAGFHPELLRVRLDRYGTNMNAVSHAALDHCPATVPALIESGADLSVRANLRVPLFWSEMDRRMCCWSMSHPLNTPFNTPTTSIAANTGRLTPPMNPLLSY